MNSISLLAESISSDGLLFYSIKTNHGISTGKMLLMD